MCRKLVSGVARSMGLCKDKRNVPDRVRMQVHAMMNSIHNFVSGENFFRSMLKMPREEYIPMVKETSEISSFCRHLSAHRPETVRKNEQGL